MMYFHLCKHVSISLCTYFAFSKQNMKKWNLRSRNEVKTFAHDCFINKPNKFSCQFCNETWDALGSFDHKLPRDGSCFFLENGVGFSPCGDGSSFACLDCSAFVQSALCLEFVMGERLDSLVFKWFYILKQQIKLFIPLGSSYYDSAAWLLLCLSPPGASHRWLVKNHIHTHWRGLSISYTHVFNQTKSFFQDSRKVIST